MSFILFELQGKQGVNLSSFQEEDGEEVERQLSCTAEVGLRDSFSKRE